MNPLSRLLTRRHALPMRHSARARRALERRQPDDLVLALTRAWCRAQGFDAASARLRHVAPDPLPPADRSALLAALGLPPHSNDDALLSALAARGDGHLSAASVAIEEALYP